MVRSPQLKVTDKLFTSINSWIDCAVVGVCTAISCITLFLIPELIYFLIVLQGINAAVKRLTAQELKAPINPISSIPMTIS